MRGYGLIRYTHNALRVGYAELPCKVLDPDTPVEKLREYAIKDNESFGQYDFGSLMDEWDTGEEEKKNERTRTDEKYNITLFDRDDCEGAFDMPRLYRELIIPKSVIGFNYVKTVEENEMIPNFEKT